MGTCHCRRIPRMMKNICCPPAAAVPWAAAAAGPQPLSVPSPPVKHNGCSAAPLVFIS